MKKWRLLSEIKENVQGTNSDGKETGTQTNGLDQKEGINIQPEQNEWTELKKKMKRGLGTSRMSQNVLTSELQGYQKEKRKNKKLKTYLNIRKENFLNLEKKIDF